MSTEWGIRNPDGTIDPARDEVVADALVKTLNEHLGRGHVKVSREVGPWLQVPAT